MEFKKNTKVEGSYFPEEVLEEICLRLPRKSLSRFKCLSKLFYALFGSPNFQNMRHELINIKSNPGVVLYDAKNKKIRYKIDYKSISSLFPLLSSAEAIMCDYHEITNLMEYPSIFQDNDKVEIWSSCRGLHWISTKGSCKEFYIWNTTKEECDKIIPMTQEVNYKNLHGYGFGYDSKTKDYKIVIVVAKRDMNLCDVVVYTLGSNSWRRVQRIPYRLEYHSYSVEGVKFNGALYWLARDFEEEGYVYTKLVCFDIADERFEEVGLPKAPIPYPEEPLEDNMFDMSLQVFEGCLCLVFHVFSVRVDVWMMQEYGVRDSWVKIFSSCLENLTTNTDSMFIWYFKNRETLWRVRFQGDLILYDPNKKIHRNLCMKN